MKFNQKLVYLLALSTTYISYSNASASEYWSRMQREYAHVTQDIQNKNALQLEQQYYHPHWQTAKEQLKQLILGPINQNFIAHSDVSTNMVRQGWSNVQEYEVYYLQNCISARTQELMRKTQDTNFVSLPRECKEFNCSTNTLAHLYYAAKSFEQFNDKNIDTIVEFGGGYGNLARIFKNISPNTTYFIIDLPEVLALQYFFLQSTLPDIDIQMHAQVPNNFKTGGIHLIPAYIAKDLSIKTDLFISTFALSEASELAQEVINEKRFFDASVCYLVGQFAGNAHPWVNHSNIHNTIRESYNTVECHPSYFFFRGIKAYEILGLNPQA